MSRVEAVALIGHGEVGAMLARDLQAAGVPDIRAFDLKFLDARDKLTDDARALSPAIACASAAEAVAEAGLVFSAVTAAQTVEAAKSVVSGILSGAYFVDLNSASPGARRAAAAAIDGAGGRYVEAAVMSAITPRGIKSPILLGGPHAADFLAFAAPFGMAAQVYSPEIGRASAAKLCRSVLIKGLEALLTESLMAARHYGVERDVIDSLADMLPLPDWNKTASYMIGRSGQHGRRRAEEMREAAETVAEAGIAPLLSTAIARRQDLTASLVPAELAADTKRPLLDLLDLLLDGRDPVDVEPIPAHTVRR
jgi:3-hydroxyisobutyrate dehydrogenase